MYYHITVEKAMAPHSSTLAWEIPWTEKPDRLQSMGSQKVGYDQVTSLWTVAHQAPLSMGIFQGRLAWVAVPSSQCYLLSS